jgi:hypothetical protein
MVQQTLERTGKTQSVLAQQRLSGEHRHGIEFATVTLLGGEHTPGWRLGWPCPDSKDASIVTTPSTE